MCWRWISAPPLWSRRAATWDASPTWCAWPTSSTSTASGKPFDVIYERAFLCALPRTLWARYAQRCAQLLQPGRQLAGFYFYGSDPKGPPFGTSPQELHGLLDPFFEQIEDRPAVGIAGGVRRRRALAGLAAPLAQLRLNRRGAEAQRTRRETRIRRVKWTLAPSDLPISRVLNSCVPLRLRASAVQRLRRGSAASWRSCQRFNSNCAATAPHRARNMSHCVSHTSP